MTLVPFVVPFFTCALGPTSISGKSIIFVTSLEDPFAPRLRSIVVLHQSASHSLPLLALKSPSSIHPHLLQRHTLGSYIGTIAQKGRVWLHHRAHRLGSYRSPTDSWPMIYNAVIYQRAGFSFPDWPHFNLLCIDISTWTVFPLPDHPHSDLSCIDTLT